MLAARARRASDLHAVWGDIEREGALFFHHRIARIGGDDGEGVITFFGRLAAQQASGGVQGEAAREHAPSLYRKGEGGFAALDFECLRVGIQLLAVRKFLIRDPCHRIALVDRDREIRRGIAGVGVHDFYNNGCVARNRREVAGDDAGAGVDRERRRQRWRGAPCEWSCAAGDIQIDWRERGVLLAARARRACYLHAVGSDFESEGTLGLVRRNRRIFGDDGEGVVAFLARLAADDTRGRIQ